MKKIGWIVDSSPSRILKWPWQDFSSVGKIRFEGIAQEMTRQGAFANELYRPWVNYDAVVFVKMMNPSCQSLAKKLKQKGVRVIFDANVNYYESWGDYVIPGTKPSAEQTHNAEQMSREADLVVADSLYLQGLCSKYNANTVWVPDAVDTDLFSPFYGKRDISDKLRLIWSGVGKKAQALELIEPLLEKYAEEIELRVVTSPDIQSNPWPNVLKRLAEKNLVLIEKFHYANFPNQLRAAEVIISPRGLENAYEMAHTEYKIALGMSAGLAVLASPQPAYVEALKNTDAGWICENAAQWEEKLVYLIGHRGDLEQMGRNARGRVIKEYSIPVVAQRYADALRRVLGVEVAAWR